jgi:hypothetical protein
VRALILVAGLIVSIQAPASPPATSLPANSITGRITSADGKPVAGAVVTLLERSNRHGQSVVQLVDVRGFTSTDADGRYTLLQLPLGEFYVMAIPHNPLRAAGGGPNRAGVGRTYYPSAADADSAMTVTVNVRQAVTADITMRAAPLAIISGVVLDSKGQPPGGERLHVAHGDHLFGLDGIVATLRPDGSFLLPPMPPGTYFLQYRENGWPPPRDQPQLISAATVVLDGRDQTVKVVPLHMVHGSGRVIVDPAERASFTPADFHVAVYPIVSDGNPGPQRTNPLKDDLSFDLDAWPARVWMRLLPEDAGWQIRRVRYKGADVTDSGIDFREDHPVAGIEIEIGRRASGRSSGPASVR